MKHFLLKYAVMAGIIANISVRSAFAQVTISYSSPQVYTYGTAITALSPTVTAGWYGTGSTFASVASADGCYYSPATGDVYATSTSNNNGYIYNSSGTLLFTQSGTTYSYSYPESIVADASGTTFVASHNNGTVKKLTTGGVETSISGFSGPIGLAFDGSGNLYVTDGTTGDVYKIASGATTASVFLTGFNSPWGIAIDASGNMFVSETGNNDIKEVANAISGGTTKTTFATGFSSPRCLAFDAVGDLFVADCGNSAVKKISPGGTVTTVISSGLGTDVGISIDGSGDLYVSSFGLSKVFKFVPLSYSISPALPAGLSLNSYTGVISGTPTACSPATSYTITGNNGTNSGTATINITVNPAAPNGTGASVCGSGNATLTASDSSPTGGVFNWYSASTGGSTLATGASYTTPTIISTTTYYVDYTVNGATSTPRTAVPATVSGGSGPVLATVPTSGAYLSYSFTGGSLTDQTGGGNTAIQYGSPTTTTDRFGVANNAYYFDGTYKYITTTKLYASPGPANFSISLWFKTTTGGGKLIGFGTAQIDTSANDDRNIYLDNSGHLCFGIYPNPTETLTTVNAYNDGNWHHVVATESSTNGANLYVDGALQAGDPTMTTCQVLAGYWRIAFDRMTGWPNHSTNRYYTGAIDDIAVYNSVLSASQVYTAYGSGSSSACIGNPLTLQVNTVPGATYAWSGPNGFTSTAQNPTVTSNATAASAGTYTCTVTNSGGCSSVITVTVPSNALTFNWTGANSTDPATAGNWSCTTGHVIFTNAVPSVYSDLPRFDGTANLVIPNGLTNYPSLTANVGVYGLTIASGASLNLNGYTLSAGCNIINSAGTSGTTGILYGSNTSSGLTWNGSVAAQSYTGTNTVTTAELGNMTVNNSAAGTVTINSGPVDIFNMLTITSGNLVVGASPAALTLKSTASLTASVAAIPSAYSITGTVTVERYLTGGSGYRGYRMGSSPVYNGTVGTNNVCSINYLQNSMYLSGSPGGGFDKTGNPCIYLFREDQVPSNAGFTTGNWWGINAINNTPAYNYAASGLSASGTYNIPAGNGYLFFYRGNRATASLATEATPGYTSPTSATLSASGTLNQGQVTISNWYTPASANLGYTTTVIGAGNNAHVRGFNLVGNPYASSIDWETYNTSSATTGIYAKNVGISIYEFNDRTHNYAVYQKGGIATNNGTRTIVSGQAFFVQATSNSSPQLIFNESAKVSTQNTGLNLFMSTQQNVVKLENQGVNPHIRLQMTADSINTDDVYIGFSSGASAKFSSDEDVPYKQGQGVVSLASFSSDSVRLAINKMPLPTTQQKVIPLGVTSQTAGTYSLDMTELEAIPNLYDVWLMDKFNKDSLDMRHNASYRFDITTDTGSYGRNRFQLVIRENPALMVHLLSFNATKAVGGSQVVWQTENEQNYTNFTVERSTDGGATFNVLDGIASTAQGIYSFLDSNPQNGADIYRLKLVDLNGTITYSNVVTLMYGNSTTANSLAKTGILVYPNPTKSTLNLDVKTGFNQGTSTISISSALQGASYDIQITNVLGSVVKQASIQQQTWQTDVSSLMPGTYIIQVINKNNNTLAGKETFVKL